MFNRQISLKWPCSVAMLNQHWTFHQWKWRSNQQNYNFTIIVQWIREFFEYSDSFQAYHGILNAFPYPLCQLIVKAIIRGPIWTNIKTCYHAYEFMVTKKNRIRPFFHTPFLHHFLKKVWPRGDRPNAMAPASRLGIWLTVPKMRNIWWQTNICKR